MGRPGDADDRVIEKVDLHFLRVPLVQPYRLAFGDLHAFDTLVVELTDRDGRSGFGEATIVTGYTDEVVAETRSRAEALAPRLCGATATAFTAAFATLRTTAPFLSTAFLTALDMLRDHPALRFGHDVRVPLLALLQGDGIPALETAFERILAGGYRTVKVKVGLSGDDDLARIRDVQAVVRGRARIRIDANQALTGAEAVALLQAIDPQDIELFEQPCAADDLEGHRRARAVATVPLMLDESIYGLDDIDLVGRERLADIVKVKLMKFGRLDDLITAIDRIDSFGMRTVLGNGVACDPGCWMEACIAARHCESAGEMNGFLKTRASLLRDPPRMEDGHLVIEAGYRPTLDREALARFAAR